MQGELIPPALPMATDHPDKKNMLTIYTQNAHGLRANEDKLEYISRLMDSKSINAYICYKRHTYQETSLGVSQKGNSWSTTALNLNQTKVWKVALQLFFFLKWKKAGKEEEASSDEGGKQREKPQDF